MNMAKALGVGRGIVDERMGPQRAFASDGQPYEMVSCYHGNAIGAMSGVLTHIADKLGGAKGILEWRLLPNVDVDEASAGWRARARFRVVLEGTRLKKWDESRQCYVDADGVFACDEPLKPFSAVSQDEWRDCYRGKTHAGAENSSATARADRNDIPRAVAIQHLVRRLAALDTGLPDIDYGRIEELCHLMLAALHHSVPTLADAKRESDRIIGEVNAEAYRPSKTKPMPRAF